MRVLVCLLAVPALAQLVKEDQTSLRAGCAAGAEAVAALAGGTAVKIRYVLAGQASPCYAVTVEVAGKKLQGYLDGASLSGLEEFDAARRRASSAVLPLITRGQVEQPRETASPAAAVDRAAALLHQNQPEGALGILETALRRQPRDPRLLNLAGMAAYQLDDARSALAYWKESLELDSNPAIERMLQRLQREMAADKSIEKTYGSRFLLRYDGAVADPEMARALVATLEQEFTRISLQLSCRAEERIVTIVQSRQSYRSATGGPEWNGGQFDGRIRVPLDRIERIDANTRRILAHELVHACLATLGRWPAWVHEGLAQKLSGDSPPPAAREMLRELARSGRLPPLESLGDGWGRLSTEESLVRYALSLAAVEELFRRQGSVAARNLLNNPENLPRVAADLDRTFAAPQVP